MFHVPAQPKFSRKQREVQMLDTIREMGEVGVTATTLFRLCGLKRTPYANGILSELVDAGEVVWETQYLTNRMPVRVYYDRDTFDNMMGAIYQLAAPDAEESEDLPF